MKSYSIVFCGGGEISLATLKTLAAQFEIEAVITKPDTVIRGKNLPPTIKTWSLQQGLAVYQPATTTDLTGLVADQNFRSPVAVIAEYGLIIPAAVINSFPQGMINSHFSLLPRWRGADPIRAVILNGDQTTGVTIIKITPELDAGDMIAQTGCTLSRPLSVTELTQQLIAINNQLLPPALKSYLSGQITPQPQIGAATHAPKIDKSAGAIDWTKPAQQLEREIRAYLGWPGSYTSLAGIEVTITAAAIAPAAPTTQPGRIIIDHKLLMVETGHDRLIIKRLKPAGKSEMEASAFLAGYGSRL